MPVFDKYMELKGGSIVFPCEAFNYASVQVIPQDYGSTTGVLEVKRSLTGMAGDMDPFVTAATPNMTTKAILRDLIVRDVGFLHIDNTTADSGKHVRVYVHLSDDPVVTAALGSYLSPVLWGYNSAASSESASPFTIDIDTISEVGAGLDYTNSSGELTINETGTYRIHAEAGPFTSFNSNREAILSIQYDSGGGFGDVSGSLASCYVRGTVTDQQHVSSTIYLAMSAGDKIRLRITPSATLGVAAEECRIDMARVD